MEKTGKSNESCGNVILSFSGLLQGSLGVKVSGIWK